MQESPRQKPLQQLESPHEKESIPEQEIPQQTESLQKAKEPWYLSIHPPSISKSLRDRQVIPDAPENSPVLVKPMLDHLSLVVGLDDLRVLDLRNLDPPPALGSSVIMILGTARSERHLHVSADRFCKWLRAEHRLRPAPDGLIGPGQLKIRLRRKAKRVRLLSKAGSTDTSTYDDGISTGWICVRVAIEQPEIGHVPVVGFRDRLDTTTVVIQMMTAPKRQELELESMWENALKRHQRREHRLHSDTQRRSPLKEDLPMNQLSKLNSQRRAFSQLHTCSDKQAFAKLRQRWQEQMQVPENAFVDVLRELLSVEGSDEARVSRLYKAVTVVEEMQLRGYETSSEEIRTGFEGLLLAINDPSRHGIRTDAVERICQVMPADRPIDEGKQLDDMTACAARQDWPGVWQGWRRFAQMMQPRSKAVYMTMFDLLSQRGHSAEIQRGLRSCLAEMQSEEPPVLWDGDLASRIRKCLQAIDPDIENAQFGEWSDLWRVSSLYLDHHRRPR